MYVPKSELIKYEVRMVDGQDPEKSYRAFITYVRNTSKKPQCLARRMLEHGIISAKSTTRYIDLGNGRFQLQRRRDEYPLFEFIPQN